MVVVLEDVLEEDEGRLDVISFVSCSVSKLLLLWDEDLCLLFSPAAAAGSLLRLLEDMRSCARSCWLQNLEKWGVRRREERQNNFALKKISPQKKVEIEKLNPECTIDTLHGNECHVRSRQRRKKKISSSGRPCPCLSIAPIVKAKRRSTPEIPTWSPTAVLIRRAVA